MARRARSAGGHPAAHVLGSGPLRGHDPHAALDALRAQSAVRFALRRGREVGKLRFPSFASASAHVRGLPAHVRMYFAVVRCPTNP